MKAESQLSGKPLAGNFPAFSHDRLVNLRSFGGSGFFVGGKKRKIVAATRMFNSGGKLISSLNPALAAMLPAKQSCLPVSNIHF